MTRRKSPLSEGKGSGDLTPHSVGGDYRHMTNALASDTLGLYNLLNARRKDLMDAIDRAKVSGSSASIGDLALAVSEIDKALVKVVAKLSAEAEEEEALLSAAEDDGETIPEDAPPIGGDDEEPPMEEPSFSDEPSEDEPMAEDEPELEPDMSGMDEELPPEASGEVPEVKPMEDDSKSDNPVAMSSKLRKAMSDPSADMLDEYALKVYGSVLEYFENLTKKALDLGTENPGDGQNSLRETLVREVGRRGLANVEANFPEWRQALMKKIWKDVSSMFEVPETEESVSSDFPVTDVPVTPDTAAPAPAEEPAAVDSTPIVAAASPFSFTLHRDLHPAAARKRVNLE